MSVHSQSYGPDALHTAHAYMAPSQCESKSIMKARGDGRGGECEEVVSFEKALVYCWRACIYFMPPQIVGKGRADSFGVIREVERVRALPQRAALLRYS